MKKKLPSLKRNLQFYDPDMSLTMDVQTKPDTPRYTIMYNDAKTILKKSRSRTDSISVAELEEMCDLGPGAPRKRSRQTLLDSDESDDELDDTVVDLTNDDKEKNTSKKSS